MAWLKAALPDAGVIRLTVRVQPRASKDEFAGVRDGVLRVRLRAPPVEGAANEALVRFLADEFGIPRRDVTIVLGFGSRTKTVQLDSAARPALDRIMAST